jgi:hypothetical protein
LQIVLLYRLKPFLGRRELVMIGRQLHESGMAVLVSNRGGDDLRTALELNQNAGNGPFALIEDGNIKSSLRKQRNGQRCDHAE